MMNETNKNTKDKKSLKDLSEKELFQLYSETKDKEVRNELVNRYLYIAEILSKNISIKGLNMKTFIKSHPSD